MNGDPDRTGISKKWKPGEDDRIALKDATGMSKKSVDAFLLGLSNVLWSRPRTKFVGFGVFEWLPWRNRIPTGKVVETWRLAFKPSRYAKKYKEAK